LFVARGSCAAAGKEVAASRCGDQAGKRSDRILGRDPTSKRPAMFAGLYSMKEMMAPEHRRGDDSDVTGTNRSAMHKRTHPAPERTRRSGRTVPTRQS